LADNILLNNFTKFKYPLKLKSLNIFDVGRLIDLKLLLRKSSTLIQDLFYHLKIELTTVKKVSKSDDDKKDLEMKRKRPEKKKT